jgi:hypothetical protein
MPPGHPGLGMEQMCWKYWREFPAWEGSRSFVMEREGAVVAHGSVIPLTCSSAGQRLRIVNLIDWAALRDCTGAGITLLKRVGQMADGVFVAGGSPTAQAILPALGFKPVGTAVRFFLPLRLLARLPGAFRGRTAAGRLGRNLLLAAARGHSGAVPPAWRVRHVLPAELQSLQFPTPRLRQQERAIFERTAAEITYLLNCPAAPGKFHLVERDGVIAGYFVLTLAARQCRIADAWIDSDEVDDWRILFTLASRQAKTYPQVAELAAVANTNVETQALRQAGFPRCGRVPLRLWIRKGKGPETVRYQMADGDAAYLHEGD